MELGQKKRFTEKEQGIMLVFQTNPVGLKMLEDLKILRTDLKKLDLIWMRLMEYWVITGIIFTKV